MPAGNVKLWLDPLTLTPLTPPAVLTVHRSKVDAVLATVPMVIAPVVIIIVLVALPLLVVQAAVPALDKAKT